LKWNRTGDRLLSCSVDQSVCVWDGNSGKILQQYLVHSGPILDADWSPVDPHLFATAGTEGSVFIYRLEPTATNSGTNTNNNNSNNSNGTIGMKEPKKLVGHTGDVNSVRFDPSGSYLATGSDDRSVRIWNKQSMECMQQFQDHQKAILQIRWSLAEPQLTAATTAAASSTSTLLLATASIDCTVKIYDISTAKLLHTLARHSHPVTCIAWQPGNALLVSASHDRIHLWNVRDGTLVKTFRSEGDGGVNELLWDSTGRRIVVAYADSWNYLIDLKQQQ